MNPHLKVIPLEVIRTLRNHYCHNLCLGTIKKAYSVRIEPDAKVKCKNH